MKTLLLALGFSALAGFARAAESARPDTGNLLYREFVAATSGYDETFVWEGLPHPFEKAALERELATKKTFRIGDQPFYAQPLVVKDTEKALINDAVLKHRENFKKWSGVKLCGGFHADYAIEWRAKGKTVAQALFCFSCEEVELRVSDKTERVDLGTPAIRALLSAHHDQRPAAAPNSPKPTP